MNRFWQWFFGPRRCDVEDVEKATNLLRERGYSRPCDTLQSAVEKVLEAVDVGIKEVNKQRLRCRHQTLRAVASTGAELHSLNNVTIGITIHCANCESVWTTDLVAGCPEAWGNRSTAKTDEAFRDLNDKLNSLG